MAGRSAVFFDLDRTLMAGSSAFEFGRAAYRAGLLSRRRMASSAYENLRFRLVGSTDERTDELRDRIASLIEGVDARSMQRLAPDVLAGVLPRLYPQMLKEAWMHQDAGRPVYIMTAASQEIAGLLALILGFDGGIGARSEIVDGRYTGRGEGIFTYREGKAEAIRKLAADQGFDLAESYAYSDSESDLPMLRAVGHPVAVNPDRPLAKVAAEEGWEIMTFETIGRRLVLGGAILTTALAGGIGALVARRDGRRWV
ncbi:MAG: HAD-IB family hydrolase [Solirubrobacterales bacterium]|nr:HAD-IB family hydrolase [Solirubrobacterales bacterium]